MFLDATPPRRQGHTGHLEDFTSALREELQNIQEWNDRRLHPPQYTIVIVNVASVVLEP